MTTIRAVPADIGDHVAQVGGLRMRYLDAAGGDPPIVLLHGLSANANVFGGIVQAGLAPAFRLLMPELRGRGASDKPAAGYSMADHAADVIALLDRLGLDRVVMAGHSFGAFLSIYLAAHFPERVTKLVVIDAALVLNPRVGELLKPSLDRLTRVYPSAASYLAELRAAPYLGGYWDPAVESYFRAEIHENDDGTVRSSTSAAAIAQCLDGVRAEPWGDYVARVPHSVLLLNALGAYGPPGTPALVGAPEAHATARAFRRCRYVAVPGNHMTMMFGDGAAAIVHEITAFVQERADVTPAN